MKSNDAYDSRRHGRGSRALKFHHLGVDPRMRRLPDGHRGPASCPRTRAQGIVKKEIRGRCNMQPDYLDF